MDGRVFVAFVERVLVPSLRPGQTVILDNLSAHENARARASIEAAGCELRFLPPYAPDFNPTEQAFAKRKQRLQRQRPRSREAVKAAITNLLPAIALADAHAFFADAGFPLP
jgi:transposase